MGKTFDFIINLPKLRVNHYHLKQCSLLSTKFSLYLNINQNNFPLILPFKCCQFMLYIQVIQNVSQCLTTSFCKNSGQERVNLKMCLVISRNSLDNTSKTQGFRKSPRDGATYIECKKLTCM